MTLAEIEAIIHRGVPLAAAWGVRVLSASAEEAVLELPRDPALLRPGETVSGPAIMGLADMAMWAVLLAGTGGRDESLTASMHVNFLRPCGPGPISATARLIKGEGRSIFGEILIRPRDSEDVAVHVTTSWVRSRPATAGAA
ncbi:PaaI family thioesterase [Roseococcus sp. SDR]|uniref:PaaI family thioesterase n=1 Tax=Roseococcus sp. SDR TaxID=2835532 RepID=UPI001BCFB417|nr:PaaI family thioesterase [Roseococcus sp. SDR]MBS7789859.1 PaaI family thioesterase [Roseococcus sp. SDR]MBV1845173.1 PaaI family thioesterase [Roseococcus sp. SDR]